MKKKLELNLSLSEIKAYDAKTVESDIFAFWEENGYFKPEYNLQDKENRFTIVLPPPNANGNLHLGHAAGYSTQDLMGRYKRMKGMEVLLLPGKDHAGIQTEVVFEKELSKKNIRKRELGREAFYEKCYEFSMANSANARSQEKRLGLSADYDREIFTLDPRIKKTVFETFVKMYEEGLLYRGKRIINWCPRCRTALADIDTEGKEEKGKLYYIAFGPFTIATTRPETKIADTAIAVNPHDARYKKYIDTEVTIVSPEGTYNLPVIADDSVDKEFGTGVLKVTPGHSAEDFKIGLRHNLPIKTVIDFSGRMAPNAGKYAGMKVLEAREAIVKDLDEMGLLVKVEEVDHNIKVCERCKSTIEPLISYQWFVKLDDMKRKAIQSVTEEKIHFHPSRQGKNFIHWLEVPEDWCISRQLWWGYQIPAWYCGERIQTVDENGNVVETIGENGCGEIIVSTEKPEKCSKCGNTNLTQDPDVLDTWYSSGQWPFATLMARDNDFENFFPTQVMETGRDILTFWVARMVMLSLYRFNVEPFKDVYLHGLVLDKEGKKQSKSKNNGIDPMQMIDKFGADALRLSLLMGNAPDQDFRLYDEKVKGFRNFINKIWNASRFIMLQMEGVNLEEIQKDRDNLLGQAKELIPETFALHVEHVQEVDRSMDLFRFGKAGDEVFNYFWHRFCDIDIEIIKKKIQEETENKNAYIAALLYILEDELKIMHPFVPFVTEYLWQIMLNLGALNDKSETIMYATYPEISKN